MVNDPESCGTHRLACFFLLQGYFHILMGENVLGIESHVIWATPGSYTVDNFPCDENGANCINHETYVDPSNNLVEIHRRLAQDQPRHGTH